MRQELTSKKKTRGCAAALACLNTDKGLCVSTPYVGGSHPAVVSIGNPTHKDATRPSLHTPLSASSTRTNDHPISPSQLCRSSLTRWPSLGRGSRTLTGDDSCAIHTSGRFNKGSFATTKTCDPALKSSGGCKKAQNPNFAIMGQVQGPNDPGLDAYPQGGGGM